MRQIATKLCGTTSRTVWAAMAVAALTCSLAFAGPFPGKWKFADGGKAIRQRPVGMTHAIVTNDGPDPVIVSSKGITGTNWGTVAPGDRRSLELPRKAKNVKIVDAKTGNALGAKGMLMWAKKVPNIPPVTGGGGS